MLDSKGLVCESRLHELQHHKLKFAHDVGEMRACSSNRSTHAFRDCIFTIKARVRCLASFSYDSERDGTHYCLACVLNLRLSLYSPMIWRDVATSIVTIDGRRVT